MLQDRAYLRLFRSDPNDLTQAEIRRLLDEESDKNDPDTELIEYCLDALNEKIKKRNLSGTTKRFSLKTAAAAAAILLILLFCGTAAASFLNIDLFDPLVNLYTDRIRIGHSSESVSADFSLTDTSLAKSLAENGISPVLLPKALTDGTYTVDSVEYENTQLIRSANIHFSDNKTDGTMVISIYAADASLPVTDYKNAKNAEAFQTGRISCYIFKLENNIVIDFSDGRTIYSIIMNSDRDTAAALAQTIQ